MNPLRELAAVAIRHPYDRKLLVCRQPGHGRELLRALALDGVAWTNVEVTTPLRLAEDLALAGASSRGQRVADEFAELGMLDEAIDTVLAGADGRLAELSEGPGLRQAVASSVHALRMAGLSADDLERVRFRDEDKRVQIARIMAEYDRLLRTSNRADAAGILAEAIARLEADPGLVERQGPVLIMPGQSMRGLTGRLLELLLAHGAVALAADPVIGMAVPPAVLHRQLEPHPTGALTWLHDPAARPLHDADIAATGKEPAIDLFSATSVDAELREVLRRVIAAGLRWDEVEIVASDAAVYGIALDGLAQRLRIPITLSSGLPITRTRPGRAVAKYLEWVGLGLPAELLRQMLERGDLAAPAGDATGMALARRLRALRIGRGRYRYEAAFARAVSERAASQPTASREDGAIADERAAAELAALAAVVRPLLDALPDAGGGEAETTRTSPAELARGVLVMLEQVPVRNAADAAAKERLRDRAERIANALPRDTTIDGAIAVLLARLTGTSPADGAGVSASAGGHLHLSGFGDGGYTGRRATFVVGLDAARFPGAGGGDALLVDDDRRRLTAGQRMPALPTAAERIDEKRFGLAALAARLRGRVTFSYATWNAVEGRALAPAPEMLQVHRLLSGNATADYEALHARLTPAASAVPRGAALLDGDDVWLHALSHDESGDVRGALRRGVTAVCSVYPNLAAGVGAWKARYRSPVPNAHLGMISPRPSLDLREDAGRVVSATELQTLGSCPHRYLLRHVLHVRKPQHPQHAPDAWLSPVEKGRLMHELYDRTLRQAAATPVSIDADAFEALALDTLESLIAAELEVTTVPGAAILESECAGLREDARAFVAMVREDLGEAGRSIVALERSFGHADEPLELRLPDGSAIRLRGAIDRVDMLPDGRLVVIDYKTGGTLRYAGRSGAFDGGRRLQHALYAEAAERLFARTVARAEYHFPTRHSQNHRARYDRRVLRDGLAIVTDLLEMAALGWFIPTNAADDCRFCDYTATCRVRVDAYDKVESKLAEWSSGAESEPTELMRRIRR
ncbi:MAG: PD-(D/E)XK nuclease family protein [Gemmatimonadota bacterium]